MDASTVSWPLVKFSRFHSSQQCDERKAVMLSARSISKIPPCGETFQHTPNSQCLEYPQPAFQPHVSFREIDFAASLTTNSYPARQILRGNHWN